ncbi:MAG: hypothetical protein ABEJ02_02505 [Candidatus Paceibacteria bacterium]
MNEITKDKKILFWIFIVASFIFLSADPSFAVRRHDIGYKCNGNDNLCRTGNCETYCVANSASDCAKAYGGSASDWDLDYAGNRNFCINKNTNVKRRPEPKQIGEKCKSSDECKGVCTSPKEGKGKKICTCDFTKSRAGAGWSLCEVNYGNRKGHSWQCVEAGSTPYTRARGISTDSETLKKYSSKAKYAYCFNEDTGKAYFASEKTVMAETSTGKTGTIRDVLSRSEIKNIINKPSLKEQIPGLDFTQPEKIPIVDEGGTRYLLIPYLGEYISAVYRWSVGAAGVLATLVIIVSAIQWMFPALNLFTEGEGNQKRTINQAKSRILNSITGLVIAVGSYIILFTINPELVEFDALKVKFIEKQELALPASDGKYTPEGSAFSGKKGEKPKDMDKLDKCIYNEFLNGLKLGEAIPTKEIDMWGIKKIKVNENAANYFKNVVNSIENLSKDSKARGYLRYIKDFNKGKVPDLQGKKDGKGAITQFQGGNGLGKGNEGDTVKFLRSDMHALGLAVDIMTRSNWDVKGMSEAKQYCNTYQKTIKNNKKTFNKDRYNGIFKKIQQLDCDNLNDVKDINVVPEQWINIFEANKFYWAGNGWGEKNRSDGMHFELYGPGCLNIRQQKG